MEVNEWMFKLSLGFNRHLMKTAHPQAHGSPILDKVTLYKKIWEQCVRLTLTRAMQSKFFRYCE